MQNSRITLDVENGYTNYGETFYQCTPLMSQVVLMDGKVGIKNPKTGELERTFDNSEISLEKVW